MTDAMTRHSDAEILAAFIDGHLDREEREAVTTHLATCEECRSVIGEAAMFEQEEMAARAPRRAPRGTWWAAAAAVMIISIAAFPSGRRRLIEREIRNDKQAVFSAQVATTRQIEGRFSDQSPHAEYRVNRGAGDRDNETDDEMAARFKLEGAIAELATSSAKIRSREATRADAVRLAIENHRQEALTRLVQIPPNERDAATWNDIAVLSHENGNNAAALDAANHALQAQPKMPEALFTRAVILYRSRRTAEAIKAWQDYLAVDPTSAWAEEARKNLADPQ